MKENNSRPFLKRNKSFQVIKEGQDFIPLRTSESIWPHQLIIGDVTLGRDFFLVLELAQGKEFNETKVIEVVGTQFLFLSLSD